jgi:hypothetical protein
MRSQSSQRAHPGAARSPRIGERGEEGIAFGAGDKTALSFDRPCNQRVMLSQNRAPSRTEHRRQPRRTLDVCEQQGDRSLRRPRRLVHAESLNLDDDFDSPSQLSVDVALAG